jgi:Na+/proline symporter
MSFILAVFKFIQQLLQVFVGFFYVDIVSNWNVWMLVSIMQQHLLQTQFRRVYKQSQFLRVMYDSKGIYQAIYIIAEHKIIFLSEERYQLLMMTSK